MAIYLMYPSSLGIPKTLCWTSKNASRLSRKSEYHLYSAGSIQWHGEHPKSSGSWYNRCHLNGLGLRGWSRHHHGAASIFLCSSCRASQKKGRRRGA